MSVLDYNGLQRYHELGYQALTDRLYTGESTGEINLYSPTAINASLSSPNMYCLIEEKYHIPVGAKQLSITLYSDSRYRGNSSIITVWLVDPDNNICRFREDFNVSAQDASPRSGRKFQFSFANPDSTKKWIFCIGAGASQAAGAITTNPDNPTAGGQNISLKLTNYSTFMVGDTIQTTTPNFNFYPCCFIQFTDLADIPRLEREVEVLENTVGTYNNRIAAIESNYQIKSTTENTITSEISFQEAKHFNIDFYQPEALGFRNYCNLAMRIKQGENGSYVDTFRISVRHGGETVLFGENKIRVSKADGSAIPFDGIDDATTDFQAVNLRTMKRMIKEIVAQSTDFNDFKTRIANW